MGKGAKGTRELDWPWTDARFRNWLISHLRRISYRYPAIYLADKLARTERNKYKCASCDKVVTRKERRRDHLIPIVDPLTGFTTWDKYIERMFCRIPEQAIQVLCLSCHSIKTRGENASRTRKTKKRLASS